DLAYVLRNFAATNIRTLESVVEEKREAITKTFDLNDLDLQESHVWCRAQALLQAATPAAKDLGWAVAELGDGVRGLCRNNVVYLNRPELKSLTGSIRVLAHEIAHGL